MLRDPKKPTKKYVKSLLRSEGLAQTARNVENCMIGWGEAVEGSDEERLRQLPQRITAWEGPTHGGMFRFPEHLGYLTYVYAYTDALRVIDGIRALVLCTQERGIAPRPLDK